MSSKLIGQHNFGFGIDIEAILIDLCTKLEKLNDIDARVVLSDIYESKFGIYNHLNKSSSKINPLASVSFFEAEETLSNSLLSDAIRSYLSNGIKELYDINLLEYLELPFGYSKLFLEIASEENNKKNKIINNLNNSFDLKK